MQAFGGNHEIAEAFMKPESDFGLPDSRRSRVEELYNWFFGKRMRFLNNSVREAVVWYT